MTYAFPTRRSFDLSIQEEITQRLKEIARVSEQTQFNGVNVLAKDTELKIQVGANDNQTISINLKKIDSNELNLRTFSVAGANGTGTATNATLKEFLGDKANSFTGASATSETTLAMTGAAAGTADLVAGTATVSIDRKSTRLNSSH